MSIEEKESYRWLQNIRHSTELLGRPERCVHIGDRESDIYELFCLAQEMGTRFVIRTCVDRLASNGQTTIAAIMKRCPWAGIHTIQGSTQEGQVYSATLRIRYKKVLVQPPIGKEKKYPPHTLTVIHAIEQTKPKDRERIEWKLITNLEVDSLQKAVEKLSWYAKRWKIEVFHKILKSGCKAEESKLRTTERLVNQVAMFCIIGWRVFWMTMIGRESEPMPATCAFTPLEVHLLDQLVNEKRGSPCENKGKELAFYILKLARLGGYLTRAADPPPGNVVMWRGMSRLNDIQLGFQLATTLVGNSKAPSPLTKFLRKGGLCVALVVTERCWLARSADRGCRVENSWRTPFGGHAA